MSAMDMTEMSGIDHSTMTETSSSESEMQPEMDYSGMDMSGMAH